MGNSSESKRLSIRHPLSRDRAPRKSAWASRLGGALRQGRGRGVRPLLNEALGYRPADQLVAARPRGAASRAPTCASPPFSPPAAASSGGGGAKRAEIDLAQVGATLGLSLGEYTALFTPPACSPSRTRSKLVHLRGDRDAGGERRPRSGMTSILGADAPNRPSRGLRRRDPEGGVCVVANLNAPGQVVISGDIEALDRADKARGRPRLPSRDPPRGRRRLPLAAHGARPRAPRGGDRTSCDVRGRERSPSIGNVDATRRRPIRPRCAPTWSAS